MSPHSRTDLLLSAARARLHRLTPLEALDAVAHGAVVVDIRPAAQRAEHGDLPGALVIERNVLEWRFDPTSDAALRLAADPSRWLPLVDFDPDRRYYRRLVANENH